MDYQAVSDDVQFDAPAKPQPKVDTNAANIRTNIVKVSDAMSEFDAVSAGLADLAARFPVDVVYDVSTGKGMVEALAHRAAWRDPRLAVERLRKQAKAPVIALGKDIDARAAWLTEQLLIGEEPIDAQIKAEEARKEAIRQKKIHDEFARTQAIQDAIAEIHMDAMALSGKPAATIAAGLDAMRALALDPRVFQEQMAQAEAARTAAVAKLELAHKAALHTEAEAAKLAADRAELEQLRKAAAEAAAAKVIADEKQRAEQRAEADRLAEARVMIAKAEQEAAAQLEAERRALAAEKAAWLAEQQQAAAQPVAAPPVAPEPAAAPAAALPVAAPLAPAAAEPATISTGGVAERLGFAMSVEFITETLGVPPAMNLKRACYWNEAQFLAICAALTRHVAAVAVERPAVAA